MTKEENILLAENIRKKIYELRKKGYTFKIFGSVVNYSSSQFYNFMNKEYRMKDEDLIRLKN